MSAPETEIAETFELQTKDAFIAQLPKVVSENEIPQILEIQTQDTLFAQAARPESRFDAVVALYHDQGLIPVKLASFGQATNVTLGLPIVRTSPDHGTAFDIVGQGKASPESFLVALDVARELARQRD